MPIETPPMAEHALLLCQAEITFIVGFYGAIDIKRNRPKTGNDIRIWMSQTEETKQNIVLLTF